VSSSAGPADGVAPLAVQARAVGGIGEVGPGDDLAAVLLAGLRASRLHLRDGDVLAVSSKVVSKALGLAVPGDTRDDAVLGQTVRVVAERVTPRGVTRIVEARSGPVLAAAGVDNSNVAPGTVLVLPPDPDAAARDLRSELTALTGVRLGVVVTDTMGRPWRDGQVDAAVGAAGVAVTDDLRGRVDGYGNLLEVTVRAVADEVAALADLVKGKLDGHPAALVRGLAHLVTDDDGPGAAALLRGPDADWFRWGHVEAVRASVGVPPGTHGVDPVPLAPGHAGARLRRAVEVALASPHLPAAGLHVEVADGPPPQAVVPLPLTDSAGLVAAGALAQRIAALATAEGLTVTVDPSPDGSPATVVVRTLP
jgi:coenzyme F420-0:L-glutamate ligase/coenzyme F420-1:gamma-L-glutamate ligase